MKSVLATDYTKMTQRKHLKGGVERIMSKFNALKYLFKCAENIGRTCLVYK